jgi:DNA repair protein RadC
MKEVKKNIHDGHRKRLVDLAVNAGVDNMSDVQVVEFFLTYIFPRGDVNPLAHRLLDKFENFTQIIEANQCDLMSVEGINERSAKKISLFGELFYYFTTAKMGKKYPVKSKGDVITVVEDCLRFRSTENMILIGISASNYIIARRRIRSNNSSHVKLSVRELTNFLVSAKPASLVIGHCHPYGSAVPSAEDDKSFAVVKSICESCGVSFSGAYIVGEDGVYSQTEGRLVRAYYDVDELAAAFKNVNS